MKRFGASNFALVPSGLEMAQSRIRTRFVSGGGIRTLNKS